ncbi:putative leucine-rich repeat-containing protein DDB_G0290503 [Prorops nasuta]|uniref:putative leucine-rich repeat-containing protein DDB_G0290503 n=1 Tax=Prorops nasuta TaxID=863751 RepID=UPI0034CF39B6
MSFSKARIQRFNELSSEVPPPGAYDPKFDTKVKGLVIEKTERFQDSKSVTSSSTECNLSVSSKGTGVSPATSFKVPQPLRKGLIKNPTTPISASKVKSKTTGVVKELKVKYEMKHEVADLKVECENKTQTIKEYEKHIEDLKKDIKTLNGQVEDLLMKQAAIEEQHKTDLEAMAKLQQEILNEHNGRHYIETELLRAQLLELSNEKEQEIHLRKTREEELNGRLHTLLEKVERLENELVREKETGGLVEKLKKLQFEAEEKQNILTKEIEELHKSKEKDISCLKELMITKEIELRNVQNEMQILKLQNDELKASIETMEQNHTSFLKSMESEKCQLSVYISNLEIEQSDIIGKLESKQTAILELQALLSALQCELDELKAENERLANENSRKIEDLECKHAEEINKIKDEFGQERDELLDRNKYEENARVKMEARIKNSDDRNLFLSEKLQNLEELYKEAREHLKTAEKELESSNVKQSRLIDKHTENIQAMQSRHEEEKQALRQLLNETKENYLREIDNINERKEKEVAEVREACYKQIKKENRKMKEHATKLVQNAEAVTRETLAACRSESEERVKKVIKESEAKMSAMVRETRSAAEDEMRMTVESYKSCLEGVESERNLLNEQLAKKDEEIKMLTLTVEELRKTVETQESFGQSLQIELDKAEAALAGKKEELRALKDQVRSEAAEMVSRRKRFEMIMSDNQASLAALTRRLAQSHSEVERLQDELKRNEDCIHEHREVINTMRNNTQMVQEQVYSLLQQLDAKKELIDELKAGSINEIDSLKAMFDAKIENLKETSTQEIQILKDENVKKSIENAEIKTQLDEMGRRISEAQIILLTLEEQNDSQATQIAKLEMLNNKLQGEINDKDKAIIHTKNLLETQSMEHEAALNEANQKIAELTNKLGIIEERDCRIKDLATQDKLKWKSIDKCLKDELQKERDSRELIEIEVNRLNKLNESIKKEYHDISEKYAEVIGHQNHKQRIKHVEQLKEKINRLEQELHAKMKLADQQQKMIEKLKTEEKRCHGKGKENVLGIPKSNHTTPVSSPHKPLTPLRDRND